VAKAQQLVQLETQIERGQQEDNGRSVAVEQSNAHGAFP
jgi:hypothetical protein